MNIVKALESVVMLQQVVVKDFKILVTCFSARVSRRAGI